MGAFDVPCMLAAAQGLGSSIAVAKGAAGSSVAAANGRAAFVHWGYVHPGDLG